MNLFGQDFGPRNFEKPSQPTDDADTRAQLVQAFVQFDDIISPMFEIAIGKRRQLVDAGVAPEVADHVMATVLALLLQNLVHG